VNQPQTLQQGFSLTCFVGVARLATPNWWGGPEWLLRTGGVARLAAPNWWGGRIGFAELVGWPDWLRRTGGVEN